MNPIAWHVQIPMQSNESGQDSGVATEPHANGVEAGPFRMQFKLVASPTLGTVLRSNANSGERVCLIRHPPTAVVQCPWFGIRASRFRLSHGLWSDVGFGWPYTLSVQDLRPFRRPDNSQVCYRHLFYQCYSCIIATFDGWL